MMKKMNRLGSAPVIRALLLSMTLCLTAAAASVHLEDVQPLERFSDEQIRTLENLNRADRHHLGRLPSLVVPDDWGVPETEYSRLPEFSEWAAGYRKALLVHLEAQIFGAYEEGRLVRWGPVSSGREAHPTPGGLFHLNWRSRKRASTEDPDWIMEWYFNFHNRRGLALHQYSMPGRPASHACIRLLERDAKWIYEWGEGWELTEDGQTVVKQGTPLWVVGEYDFENPRPWLKPEWWEGLVAIPQVWPRNGEGDQSETASGGVI